MLVKFKNLNKPSEGFLRGGEKDLR